MIFKYPYQKKIKSGWVYDAAGKEYITNDKEVKSQKYSFYSVIDMDRNEIAIVPVLPDVEVQSDSLAVKLGQIVRDKKDLGSRFWQINKFSDVDEKTLYAVIEKEDIQLTPRNELLVEQYLYEQKIQKVGTGTIIEIEEIHPTDGELISRFNYEEIASGGRR